MCGEGEGASRGLGGGPAPTCPLARFAQTTTMQGADDRERRQQQQQQRLDEEQQRLAEEAARLNSKEERLEAEERAALSLPPSPEREARTELLLSKQAALTADKQAFYERQSGACLYC